MTLRGTVLRRNEITIAVEPTCNAMTLSEKKTDVLLATIYERTNCATGYTVTLTRDCKRGSHQRHSDHHLRRELIARGSM
jgi:hypothetical protein